MPDTYYRRNLPHIHPEGHPLFITFRLANSIPLQILAELKMQREQALNVLKAKSSDGIDKIDQMYFSRYDEWLDRCSSGPRWLEDKTIADIVVAKIFAMNGVNFQLLSFCVMPNHVHLLIKAILANRVYRGDTPVYPVADMLRLLKGSTARDCNLKLERNGQFWNHESYDHFVRDEQELERTIKYIRNNPVKAGLVAEWKDWQCTYVDSELGSW